MKILVFVVNMNAYTEKNNLFSVYLHGTNNPGGGGGDQNLSALMILLSEYLLFSS